MAEELFTASFIADRLIEVRGLTAEAGVLRSVRYWASTRLLRASGTVFTGKGKNRLFPSDEIARAGILLALSTWGIPVGVLELCMRALSKTCTEFVGADNLVLLLGRAPKGFILFTIVLEADGGQTVTAAVAKSAKALSFGSTCNVVVIGLARLKAYLP